VLSAQLVHFDSENFISPQGKVHPLCLIHLAIVDNTLSQTFEVTLSTPTVCVCQFMTNLVPEPIPDHLFVNTVFVTPPALAFRVLLSLLSTHSNPCVI